MTEQETSEAVEAALRQRYVEELRKSLGDFAVALGLNGTEMAVHMDAVSRLFVRYESWPAYSAWRTAALKRIPVVNGGTHAVDAAEPVRGALSVAALQAQLKDRKLPEATYKRLVAWAEVHKPGALYKSRDGRMLLSSYAPWTDEELREAMK